MDPGRSNGKSPSMSKAEETNNKRKCDTGEVPPKKVKLRVTMESVLFEIDLDKLASKPDTMLGKMFSTSYNIAQPNENGEYELKNVNPLIFENMLSYYEDSKIPKPSLRENFLKTADYLQIPASKETLQYYFLTELSYEKIIMKDLNTLFDKRIKLLLCKKGTDEKNYIINVIEKRHKENCQEYDLPQANRKTSFNHYVGNKNTFKYLKTYNDSVKGFFKSKGISRLKKKNDSVFLDMEVDCQEDYDNCTVEYVILDFWC